jgi:gamma-glutamyltranspeptidase/glutathione hydrolase
MMVTGLFRRVTTGLFIVYCGGAMALVSPPPGYSIASAHPLATNAGLEILAQGGNAFDAAVAVSAALAVVEPYHSGLGGGGFWLLHRARLKENLFIDGREIAPKSASKKMFLSRDGKPIAGLSLNGGLAAAIPGEPAALVFIATHYGRLPLSTSLAPAIRLAEEGFTVDSRLVYFLSMGDRLQQLQKYPSSAAIFLHNGRPYKMGELLVQKDLAKTLRTLATKGHSGFYQGLIAEHLVAGVNKAGGIWSIEDLSSYQIKVRKPLEGNYQGMHIVTAPLPSAGGVGLLTMLNILSKYPLSEFSEAKRVHYIVEAMRLAYWQRNEYLADPDFIDSPVKQLLSENNAQWLRQKIYPNKATASTTLKSPSAQSPSENDTTHFSILDSEGNRVAASLSINYIFGSSVVAEGTGVLLNDHMDDFAIKANEKNVFGIVGHAINGIEPGKRPLSSMTPTFIEMTDRMAILGTPGGSRIPTMVLLAALSFSDSYGAITMVSKMRFHHQYLPDLLMHEPNSFSSDLKQKLQKMGYHLKELQEYYGDMQAITWDKNLITATSDPRHIGLAVVVLKENTGGYGLAH